MEGFLRRVLPDGGEYVVVAIDKDGKAHDRRGIKAMSGLVSAIQTASMKPVNVFFAVGTYKGDRKAPLAKRALFLDLDAKSFGTKAAAITQLAAFVKTVGMPFPAILVDSGGGIHAYWPFDRDLPVDEWRMLATRLKARCVSANFPADPTVTADAARVLRVPGTLNHKQDAPRPCRVLRDSGVSYDPTTAFGNLVPVASSSRAALASAVGVDDLGASSDSPSYPQVPYYATEIAEKCGVMKEALVNGGFDHTEPLWRHLLGILAFTEDGEQLIHEISKGHHGYNKGATEAKYAQVLKLKQDGKLKPILCSTFATYKGSICQACPHFGKIKTPMTLGKLEEVAYLSYPYKMADFSVQKLIKKGDPENNIPDTFADVVPYRISDVEMLDPGPDGQMQIQMLLSSKGSVVKFVIQHGALFGQSDRLAESLEKYRVWINPVQQGEFRNIMTSWLRRMTDVKKAVSIEQDGLGWGQRGGLTTFASGGRVFVEDGKDYDFYCKDSAKIRPFRPRGAIEPWKTAADALARDPRQEAVVTLLTAFAAPLVKFTGVKGVTYSLYSPESATGKSTLLKVAQSVWGHPISSMSMVDDTQNSVINKIGFMSTTPIYWDELRGGEHLKNFVKMIIFTIGQGREKTRLSPSLSQQATGSWDTLVTLASNERISDHVDQHITNTDAGRVRVFECRLPKFENPDPIVARSFTKLETNYGHAGLIYAKYLAEHHAEIEKLVQDTQEAIKRLPTVLASERYWIAFVTAIIVAARLVKRAGLLEIDMKALNRFLFVQMAIQKTGVEENYKTPAQAALASIPAYIDSHRSEMLLVEEFEGVGLTKFGNILTPANALPRDTISILKAVNDKKIRIRYDSWKDWVTRSLGASPKTLIEELMKIGALHTRRDMSGGMQAASNARVWCIEIDMALPAFAALSAEDSFV